MIGHLELDNFNGTKRLADYKDIVVLMRSTRSFIVLLKRYLINLIFLVILFYLKVFYKLQK